MLCGRQVIVGKDKDGFPESGTMKLSSEGPARTGRELEKVEEALVRRSCDRQDRSENAIKMVTAETAWLRTHQEPWEVSNQKPIQSDYVNGHLSYCLAMNGAGGNRSEGRQETEWETQTVIQAGQGGWLWGSADGAR